MLCLALVKKQADEYFLNLVGCFNQNQNTAVTIINTKITFDCMYQAVNGYAGKYTDQFENPKVSNFGPTIQQASDLAGAKRKLTDGLNLNYDEGNQRQKSSFSSTGAYFRMELVPGSVRCRQQ